MKSERDKMALDSAIPNNASLDLRMGEREGGGEGGREGQRQRDREKLFVSNINDDRDYIITSFEKATLQ